MKLVAYGPPGDEEPGLLVGEDVVSLAPLLKQTGGPLCSDLSGAIQVWRSIEQKIRSDGLRHLPRLSRDAVRLAAPLRRPGKIVGVGSNYRSADGTAPDIPANSILFLKPASSIVGPGEAIMLPREAMLVVGEVELAIVIGKAAWRVSESKAMDHVFGYMIANDVTAPEVLLGESRRNPLFLQAARGKGYPTFCPLGPWIVTIDEVADVGDLLLEQFVNDEVELVGAASLMVRSVASLVHEVSEAFGLEAGDVILSGSPRPSSARRPLVHGDVLRSRISGLGELANPVHREPKDATAGSQR